MIGTELGGYKIVAQLGQPGGFGTAYLAERDGVQYVVKVLKSEAMTTTRERFAREIRSLQKVDHPFVVKYVDHGQLDRPDGSIYYLVMPHREGRPLGQVMAEKPIWSEQEVVEIACQLADALAAIHDEDIVHRDFKPSNVYVTTDGSILVLDFGIAKLMDYSSITQGGAPGTWRYMAPEQSFESVDGRSDLYSLGVVMYEMLTGQPVFIWTGDPLSFFRRLKEEIPELPSYHNPAVGPGLENVVMKLLAKQPHQRYRGARQLIRALRSLTQTPEEAQSVQDGGVGPRFFVHVQHNEAEPIRVFLATDGAVSGVIYGASQIHTSKAPIGAAVSAGVSIVLDPETHRLARSDFSRTTGLVQLPYVRDPMTPLRVADLSGIEAYRELACNVVDFELTQRSSTVLAPYFHFPDTASDWLKKNLKLLAETRLEMNRRGLSAPLWAVISTDVETICDDDTRLDLLNRYTRTRVDGYWFLINFDEQRCSPAQLFNYSRLLLEFRSTGRTVIAGRVGSLGLGLYAAGVTGFSSGMSSLENFNWSYFTDRSNISGGKQRFYLPQLLQNVSADTVRRLLKGPAGSRLACPCPACRGPASGRLSWSQSRLHFLYARDAQLRELMRAPAATRLALFENWVTDAHSFAQELLEDGHRVRADHFPVWLTCFRELVQRGLVRAA